MLVHQLDNLFQHLFLQFQLIIIDSHGFIVILVTPPQTKRLVIPYLSIITIRAFFQVSSPADSSAEVTEIPGPSNVLPMARGLYNDNLAFAVDEDGEIVSKEIPKF